MGKVPLILLLVLRLLARISSDLVVPSCYHNNSRNTREEIILQAAAALGFLGLLSSFGTWEYEIVDE